MSQVKQIVLAMHNYHDEHGALPPAYTVDEQGNVLHSWRTLLLPYLEEKALYDSIDLTKPWDDTANAAARETRLEIYECPSAVHEEGLTSYMVVAGEECAMFDEKARTFDDIRDGLSGTIIVVEVPPEKAISWMEPRDLSVEELMEYGPDTHLPHPSVFQAGFADGHVEALQREIDRTVLKAMTTIAGAESLAE